MDVKDAGKLGGLKTLETKGKEHFKRISKIGVLARQYRRINLRYKEVSSELDKAILDLDKKPIA
jgi:hypothetical protein